ncbi:MAG: methylmalonyl Co-A mutase-associated GTPase MeaB [Deferribacteraceae bacterium]|jgi:LAO/AO transport system kinase|nr:methylmalonyl Co-A mutase-associated GTPase MeaB [Deferribacteraceae bacterium]
MNREKLVEKIIEGDVRAAARLMRIVDDRSQDYAEYMRNIWPHTGKAAIIGITGAPGAGKSTLTDALISSYRKQGMTVGVVAIDPSSPFSGGAILGDRIRMADHAMDQDVFIRSVATRGHLGGMSVSAIDIAAVLDAMGKDIIIVETVGVGQDEVEIASVADCSVVVTVPGLGDDIQAIKAGILEIADIFVVNKADREGADRTARDLQMMLELAPRHGEASWQPPVIKTVAFKNEGIEELRESINSFLATHKGDKKSARLLYAAQGIVKERVFGEYFTNSKLNEAIAAGGHDPYKAVDTLWSNFMKLG